MGDMQRIQQICDEFERLCQTPFNDSLRNYKAAGGKIVGVLYNQVAEELILAAGLLPVRLRAVGSRGDELADARFTQVNCSEVRCLYDAAARGTFDFIDGLVATNACDHIRKLYENWADVLKAPYTYLVCFPKRKGDDLQVAHLAGELANFKTSLEEHFGVQITDEALREAINLANEIRALQLKLDNLRAESANPPITGTQALAVHMAGTCMPRQDYKALLSDLVDACEGVEGQPGQKRLVIYGGEIDSLPFMETIDRRFRQAI